MACSQVWILHPQGRQGLSPRGFPRAGSTLDSRPQPWARCSPLWISGPKFLDASVSFSIKFVLRGPEVPDTAGGEDERTSTGAGGIAGRRREAAGATGKVPAERGPLPGWTASPGTEQSTGDPGPPNCPHWVSPAHMEGGLGASGNCRPWHLGPHLGAPQERLRGSDTFQNLGLLSSCPLLSRVVLRLSCKGGKLCGCGLVCPLCSPPNPSTPPHRAGQVCRVCRRPSVHGHMAQGPRQLLDPERPQ